MTGASIEWALFDWGNVLVEYRPTGFPKLAEQLGRPVDEVSSFITDTGLLRDLCEGVLEPEEGLERFEARFGTRLSRAEVAQCFAGDVERELPGIDTLLDDLEGSARLAILSNTFFGHWDSFIDSPLYARFELPMASHLLGGAKPQPEIFEAALERMGADARRVVFIDDKQENLDAAQQLGMHTVLSNCSVPTTRAGLAKLLGPEFG